MNHVDETASRPAGNFNLFSACCCFRPAVVVWNWESDSRSVFGTESAPVTCMAFHPDGKPCSTLACCRVVWSLTLTLPPHHISGLYLAVACESVSKRHNAGNAQLSVWHLDTKQVAATVSASPTSIEALSWSPDGGHVIALGGEKVDTWGWIHSALHPQASATISQPGTTWVGCVFVEAVDRTFYAVSQEEAILLELDHTGSLCVLARHAAAEADFAAVASAAVAGCGRAAGAACCRTRLGCRSGQLHACPRAPTHTEGVACFGHAASLSSRRVEAAI